MVDPSEAKAARKIWASQWTLAPVTQSFLSHKRISGLRPHVIPGHSNGPTRSQKSAWCFGLGSGKVVWVLSQWARTSTPAVRAMSPRQLGGLGHKTGAVAEWQAASQAPSRRMAALANRKGQDRKPRLAVARDLICSTVCFQGLACASKAATLGSTPEQFNLSGVYRSDLHRIASCAIDMHDYSHKLARCRAIRLPQHLSSCFPSRHVLLNPVRRRGF